MFKVKKNPTFWNKVIVNQGSEEVGEFQANFKLLKHDELEKMDLFQPEEVKKLLKRVVTEFKEFEIDGKPDATFAECLDEAMSYANIRTALFQSYVAGTTGAKQGN